MGEHLPQPVSNDLPLDGLLEQLRTLIHQGRQQALRAVDTIQVRTCWEIGHYLVAFEQAGADRAAYGSKLLARLAESLTKEFGAGFDVTNLRKMRQFYLFFQIEPRRVSI